MTYFKVKRCFHVATEIFKSQHRNQLNIEKSCRDRNKGRDTKLELICSIDFSYSGIFLISISMYAVIQFSRIQLPLGKI